MISVMNDPISSQKLFRNLLALDMKKVFFHIEEGTTEISNYLLLILLIGQKQNSCLGYAT
jgi:hypothetical protein